MLRKTKTLVISIIIFLIVAVGALYLILHKGYIGDFSLVGFEKVHEFDAVSDKEYLSVTDNEEATISITLDGEEMSDKYSITLDDEGDIVDVKENKVIAKNVGTAIITVSPKEYPDLSKNIELVVYRPIKNMKLTSYTTPIKVGNDRQITLTTTPTNATRSYVQFSSSDDSIATVNNNGIITGHKKGTVTITATDPLTEETATIKQAVQ